MYNQRDGDLSPTLVINNNMAKKVTKVTTEAQRICKELGVDRLFYNTKGEYFTNHSYAVASEGGDKKRCPPICMTLTRKKRHRRKR